MAKTGPIIVVEDDHDDQEFMEDVMNLLKVQNERIYFSACHDALHYLNTTTDSPLIILCDINLPGFNGLEFKQQIDSDPVLRSKSIPFVFLSTAVDQKSINRAYKEMTVQGFFQKSNTMDELTRTLAMIIDYWKTCRHPNSQ